MQSRLESNCLEAWVHMCQYAHGVQPCFGIGCATSVCTSGSSCKPVNTHSNWMYFQCIRLECVLLTWMRVIVSSKGPLVEYNNTHSPLLNTITRIQVGCIEKSIQFECVLTNLRVPRALRHSCVRDTELWAHIVSKLTDVRAFRLQAWLRAEITLAHFKIHGVSIKNHLFQIVYAARHALKHP